MDAISALEPGQRAALKAVWGHLPTIYVYALAYACACRISLRTWLAVSALPPAPVDVAKEKAQQRKRALLMAAFMTIVLGTELSMLYYGNQDSLDRFVSGMLGVVVFSQVAWSVSSSAIFSRLFQWRMVRSPEGFAVGRVDRSDATLKKRRVVASLATASIAGVCTAGAFSEHSCATLTMVTIWGILTAVGSRPMGKSMSIRGIIMVLLGFQAASILLPVAIVAFAMSSGGEATAIGMNTAFGEPTGGDFNGKINAVAALICPAIYAGINAYLISICYRFDYYLHLQRNPEEARPSPQVTMAEDGMVSVAIGSHNPRWFPKRYFSTSFLVTLLSHLAAPAIVSYLPGAEEALQIDPKAKSIFYGLIGMFVATPMASLAVVLLALGKREGKEMWKYREEWFKKEAVGSIKLEVPEVIEGGLIDEKKALLIIEEEDS